MKKNPLYAVMLILLLTGCKKKIITAPFPDDTAVASGIERTVCYAYEASGNKIEMKVHYQGSKVSGTLEYALDQKDRNTGTFTGTITKGILLLDYTFDSEGVKSTRQLAFKLINEHLTEDGTRFKDIDKIQFNSTMPLAKVDCPK